MRAIRTAVSCLDKRAMGFVVLLLAAHRAMAQGIPQTALPRWVPDPLSQLLPMPVPATVKDGFTLVTLGDLLYWRPVRAQIDSGMEQALRLVRAADFATANHEGTFFDLRAKRIAPRDGSLMAGPPEMAEDIKNLGVRLVSKANNHSFDWGAEGLLEERRILDAAGLPYAGAGDNRSAARAATFVDLPKGRVGVVAAASSFQTGVVPMDEDAEVPARPGISVLRTTSARVVDEKQMAVLRRMATAERAGGAPIPGTNEHIGRARPIADSATNEITLLGQTFRLGKVPGETWTMNPWDEFEILKEVRSAKKLADLVIFTIHAHEGVDGPGEGDTPYPADFLPTLFHHVIDAGGDVVAGHGSHALRGIEIYKGRPIFYGLSTFIFQGFILQTQESRNSRNLDPRFTSRGETEVRLNGSAPPGVEDPTGLLGSWDVTILPVMTYNGGRVTEIRIYPIDVRRNPRLRQSGLPRLASPELGHRILELVQTLSAPFGTKMAIEGNVGVIRPGPP